MPLYVFACTNDHEFERRLTMEEFDESKPVRCPECDTQATRKLASFTESNSTQTPTRMGRNKRWKSNPW